MEKLYFAYGSNMAIDRMFARCPGAEEIEKVRLKDWQIQFRRVLTIIEQPGEEVIGALYSITEEDELALDRYEGWPRYYDKHDLTVQSTENPFKTYQAMVYILDKEKISAPEDYYLGVCLEGCRDWGIPHDYMMRAVKQAKAAEHVRRRIARDYYLERREEIRCQLVRPEPVFESKAEVDSYMEKRLKLDSMLLDSFNECFPD